MKRPAALGETQIRSYYAIAKAVYSNPGRTAFCNSTTVPKTSNDCVFYDITQGDIDGACTSGVYGHFFDCFHGAEGKAPIGLLSTSPSINKPAYLTNVGWDFGSGIGSVNAWNLVYSWPDGK